MVTGIWSRRLAPIVVVACAAAAWPALAAGDPSQSEKLAAQVRAFGEAVNRHDCKSVVRIGEPLLDGEPRGLPASIEADAYTLVSFCAYSEGDKEKAYHYALIGSRLTSSSDDLWHGRLSLELEGKKLDAAVATVEEMSAGHRAALNSTPVRWLSQLQSDLETSAHRGLRKRLLKAFSAESYVPDDRAGYTQNFRYDYALLLSQDGDVAGARALVGGLTDPNVLIEAMFEPHLRAFLPADLDLRAAAEAEATRDRAAAARYPDRLEPVIALAADLRGLGRPQEALALLQSLSDRIGDAASFKDGGQQLPWYWDSIARSDVALGRYDDAVAAFRKGIALGEDKGPNVSQTINLAYAQTRFGHGEDALRTLSAFDDPKRAASPYGRMEMHLARGCAQMAAGHAAAADADLDYAKAHERDHPQALGDLYLCVGRMDDAAAAFIRRLGDPDRRSAALEQLSDYDDPPVNIPQSPYQANLARLKARPDVRAAIARAGRTRRIPLQYGDL